MKIKIRGCVIETDKLIFSGKWTHNTDYYIQLLFDCAGGNISILFDNEKERDDANDFLLDWIK